MTLSGFTTFDMGAVTTLDFNGAISLTSANGGFTLDGALDVSNASAGQIQFPATQNASADVNTLDDYEEGTFTPTVFDAITGGNEATYTRQEGVYTKIGNMVSFQLSVDIAGVAGMTGGNDAVIRGLPYANRAVSGNQPMPLCVYSNGVTFTDGITASIPTSVQFLYLRNIISAGSGANITVTNMGTGYFTVAGTYFTS